jgi:hypothetical protein
MLKLSKRTFMLAETRSFVQNLTRSFRSYVHCPVNGLSHSEWQYNNLYNRLNLVRVTNTVCVSSYIYVISGERNT